MLQGCLEKLQAESTRSRELQEAIGEALETLAVQKKIMESNGQDTSKIWYCSY